MEDVFKKGPSQVIELKTTMSRMKKKLDEINGWLDITEKKISEL